MFSNVYQYIIIYGNQLGVNPIYKHLFLFFFQRRIGIVRHLLINHIGNQAKSKRGMYAISATITKAGKPDKRSFYTE